MGYFGDRGWEMERTKRKGRIVDGVTENKDLSDIALNSEEEVGVFGVRDVGCFRGSKTTATET
jgi:hypothetical protein